MVTKASLAKQRYLKKFLMFNQFNLDFFYENLPVKEQVDCLSKAYGDSFKIHKSAIDGLVYLKSLNITELAHRCSNDNDPELSALLSKDKFCTIVLDAEHDEFNDVIIKTGANTKPVVKCVDFVSFSDLKYLTDSDMFSDVRHYLYEHYVKPYLKYKYSIETINKKKVFKETDISLYDHLSEDVELYIGDHTFHIEEIINNTYKIKITGPKMTRYGTIIEGTFGKEVVLEQDGVKITINTAK